MSSTIAGYTLIELIHESTNTLIYRASRGSGQARAIIKTLRSEYPTLEELARLKHEYQILQPLQIEGIAKPLALESYQNGLALILSDCGGESLKQLLAVHTLELSQFLPIAVRLAATIAALHQNTIIHKDLKPDNILVNLETGQVKIIDFGISSRLSRENQATSNPNLLEGTLAYMSPEQTGRMNRSIDYRTDFYSLGITFYEMLTGRLPFEATELLELVHCHIAKTPVPPNELDPAIPQVVSDVVMKLLAKTAEHRYQSALGLKSDLEACMGMLQTSGKISHFLIGQLDRSSQLLIPQTLYGREQEVATLMAAFERVSRGATEIMLVSGYSGIGKSSLVNEVHKPIVAARGYFISGKFDQLKRNIPYASLIQAFQELMRQLLTESNDKIADWRAKFLAVLGSNGQVIIDVIPEVEQIIGPQPGVPQLGPAESRNRLNRVFQKFIDLFCKPEHPLVLFLDDVQWADTASLKLIQLLMSNQDSQYLCLIGAYRDNEVSATHPLISTLEEIQQSGAVVNNIVLQPFDITHANQLVSDALHIDQEKSATLAELVFKKTQGNPFFLTQLLKSLYQENLLSFSFSEGCWHWDINLLQNIDITDNVIELMITQIQKLSPTTQNVLKLAACIGDRFTLDVLSIVNQKSLSATAAELWESLQTGLVLPLSESYKIPLVIDSQQNEELATEQEQLTIAYKFLHDRVQQAAYSLIPDLNQKETHLKIGYLLLNKTPFQERKEKIFSLVNQLNHGIELLTLEVDKYEIAELNLIAGQKAKAATAYEAAIRYLRVGLSLLPVSGWHQQYELALALHQEAAEAAFLSGDFEQMERLAEAVLRQAKTPLDQVKMYALRIKTCEAQRRLLDAVKLGLQVLQILGVQLTESPTSLDIKQAIEETTANLAGKGIEDLISLPPMTDANKLAALQLIASLIPAAYQSAPALFILMACQEVNLSINHGNTPLSASGFADYGVVFSGLLQDSETAYQFGRLALNLLDRLDAPEVRSQTFFKVATFILHWKKHVRETLPLFEAAYANGLEHGDLIHTGYSASNKCQYLYWSGSELKGLEQEMARCSNAIAQINQETALKWHQIFHQAVLNLIGSSENPCCLIGEAYNEAQSLPFHIQFNERTVIHSVFLNKLILCYLFGEFAQAAENATKAEQYLDGVTGWLTIPLFYFYDSLAQLAIYPLASRSQQERFLDKVTNNQEKMRNWAENAPMNFQHKYELVEAEKARVLGQCWQAMECYDRAIAGAREHGYIQEEALANEVAARFYFLQGREKIAQVYLVESYYGYLRWGATAKVKDLEARYSQTLSQIFKREASNIQATQPLNSLSTGNLRALDLATVMKASQALSGEIVIGELLARLMQIVIENAGAQKGCLLLDKAGKLFLEASGGIDSDKIVVQSIPLEMTGMGESLLLPISMINYVARTQKPVVLSNAATEEIFATDPYIVEQTPKSVLCTPIIRQGKLIGILYLENNLTTEAFTPERLQVLQLLSSQAAISIENARLYNDLADYNRTLAAKVAERTTELQAKNLRLQQEILERQAALRERQRAEEAADAANRAKSEFLAKMSHELRTPLNGILGYAQILRKNKTLTDPQKDGLGIIYQCGEHLLSLINDILDLSKIEAQRMDLYPSEFQLPEFLKGITEIVRLRAEQKGIGLTYKTLTPIPQAIRADQKRLRQVLINLLGNAVKFTARGGVTFAVGYQDGKLRFQVEDTGIGIAPEQLQEIFLPFQQVGEQRRETEGTGLGLAISRQLVQLMGGVLEVKSNSSKGSVFWFDLDLPESQWVDDSANVMARNIIGFKGLKRKVLVVDDKWANRSVLVSLLEPLGFEVVEAIDGLEALNKAREFKPDIIFMDLVMPGMDGFETTRQIKMLPDLVDVVVIAISASVFDFDQQQSQEVGCNGFLPKPVREVNLLETLQGYLGLEWVDEKQQNNEQVDTQDKALSTLNAPPLENLLVTLPREEIAVLLDRAMSGDLRGIIEQASRLEALDQQWMPLATRLRQLAKDFKSKQILELVKQYQRLNER